MVSAEIAKAATGEEIDVAFERGDDMRKYFDLSNGAVVRPEEATIKRVNVDFPVWMVAALDEYADRLAINRQAVIKTWIAERLERERVTA